MQCQTEEGGQSAVGGKSNPERREGIFFLVPALYCRYRQVGENASAALLSVVSVIGLTVKEKLGGESE